MIEKYKSNALGTVMDAVLFTGDNLKEILKFIDEERKIDFHVFVENDELCITWESEALTCTLHKYEYVFSKDGHSYVTLSYEDFHKFFSPVGQKIDKNSPLQLR